MEDGIPVGSLSTGRSDASSDENPAQGSTALEKFRELQENQASRLDRHRESQIARGGRRRSSGSPWTWYSHGNQKGEQAEETVGETPVLKSPSQSGHHHHKHRGSIQQDGGPQTLFADAQAMKGALYENIDQKDYDVTQLYSTTGCRQAMARHERFGSGTLFVICLNAIWIGVDADHNRVENPADAELHFKVADQLFCVFFTSELLIRFLSFQKKSWCMRDAWFRFDAFLVTLMVAETWVLPVVTAGSGSGGAGNLSLLKILRLLRLTRMVRIMRAMPELMTMLKGMGAATRSVAATCALLIIFLYIFSIIFSQEHKLHPSEDLDAWFGTIPRSMWTLLLTGTFIDNLSDVANKLLEKGHPLYVALFLVFVALASLTIINMLIGVLCEVVSAVAEAEKEKSVVTYVKAQLLDVLQVLDRDGTGTISKEEFAVFLEIPAAVGALEQLGVDVSNLLLLADILFDEENSPIKERKEREKYIRQQRSQSKEELTLKEKVELRKSVNAENSDSNSHGPKVSCTTESSVLPVTGLLTGGSTDGGIAPPENASSVVQLSFADMLEMILRLRSENVASVPDIVDLRKFIRWNSNVLLENMSDLKKRIATTKTDLRGMMDNINRKLDVLIQDDPEEETLERQRVSDLGVPLLSWANSECSLGGERDMDMDPTQSQEVLTERNPVKSPLRSPRTYESPFKNPNGTPAFSASGSPSIDADDSVVGRDVPSERSVIGGGDRCSRSTSPPSSSPLQILT